MDGSDVVDREVLNGPLSSVFDLLCFSHRNLLRKNRNTSLHSKTNLRNTISTLVWSVQGALAPDSSHGL